MLRRMICWTVLFLPAFLLGCGPETSPTSKVTGKVTYQGNPVPNVAVTFTPASGRPGTGTTDASGVYTISTFGDGDGAVPGMHTVTLSTTETPPMPGTPEAAAAEAKGPPFPAKYTDPTKTDLKKEVKADGDNEINLELTD